MKDQCATLIEDFNREAIDLGLPLASAEMPLLDQKPKILLAIGEKYLAVRQPKKLTRLRSVWFAILVAEQKQTERERVL